MISADATQWQVPDDLTIAYFYCPFPPHVFEEVLQQLFASLRAAPPPVATRLLLHVRPRPRAVGATGRATALDFKRPLHLRGQLRELWMFELR